MINIKPRINHCLLVVASTILINLWVVTPSVQASQQLPLADLSPLQWQHRVLLLRSETPQQDYQDLLANYATEINLRHLVLFAFNGNTLFSNYDGAISPQLLPYLKARLADSTKRYVLIGKDGGTKDSGKWLDMMHVFDLIDGMPMRQREMREQGEV